jgi:hypothetical protein
VSDHRPFPRETADRLARRALFGFVLTFVLSRITVFLIMSELIPNLFLFLNGTHIHHLNYGIFLLSALCGYSLFMRPDGRAAEWASVAYGVALALTFDEFGMWLHLGGSYWQRVSVDAVIVVAALFGLIASAPSLKRMETHHFWGFIAVVVLVAGFGVVVMVANRYVGQLVGPTLRALEMSSSP